MRQLMRRSVLGIASVLALGVGGTALDYAAAPGNAVNAGSAPPLSRLSEGSSTAANLQTGNDRWVQEELRKDDIRWAQVELRYRGLYKGSLDGVLGPETKRALQRFQRNNALDETALLDAQTWERLIGDTSVGLGGSMPPDAENAGSMTNSPASNLGR